MSSRKKSRASLPRINRYCVDVFGTLFPKREGWDFENAFRDAAVYGDDGERETVVLRHRIVATPLGSFRHGLRQTKRGYIPAIFEVEAGTLVYYPFGAECQVVYNPIIAMEFVEGLEEIFG